jgi:phosphoribosylamine--glycine ligase
MTSVLVVGSGGREHALAWKLGQSPAVDRVYVAPGNAGTARDAENVPVAATDLPGLVRFVAERDILLTVIGPEAPLALGLADALRAQGRLVVGPGAAAARLESSKSFAKDIMRRAGVATAPYRVFDRPEDARRHLQRAAYPLVVKADGLAAGKGVTVCTSRTEAEGAVEALMVAGVHGDAGKRVVIEAALTGPEVSLLALVDGTRMVPLPSAQDHKRLGDSDTGPNTGGMGAYAPVPSIDEEECIRLVAITMQPAIELLAEMDMPYRGILFAGLMLTPEGPRVLEYNCRSGDPETQVVLPLLADDLFPWLVMTAGGKLHGRPQALRGSAVGVVLAAAGYPDTPRTGLPIEGLEALAPGVVAFHAGTALDSSGRIVTAGGRVLTIVGMGRNVDDAAEKAYTAPVHFDGMQYRTDIAWQARQMSGFGYQVSDAGQGGQSFGPPPHEVSVLGTTLGRDCGSRPCPPGGVSATGADFGNQTFDEGGQGREPQSLPNLFADSWQSLNGHGHSATPHIGVLASGAGSNLQALIDAQTDCRLEAEIAAVVSHNRAAGSLARARVAGIPAFALPLEARRDLAARAALERELLVVLAPFHLDLLVLAGWMLILSEEFLDRCGCPIINVHPALLDSVDGPVLRGMHAVRDALAHGLPFTGVTVHRVTPAIDAGPILLSERVPILPDDTEDSLYARIKPVEHRLLVDAVQMMLRSAVPGGVHA